MVKTGAQKLAHEVFYPAAIVELDVETQVAVVKFRLEKTPETGLQDMVNGQAQFHAVKRPYSPVGLPLVRVWALILSDGALVQKVPNDPNNS